MDIFNIRDVKSQPDSIHPYNENHQSVPIIIDNGSYLCRVGWATDEFPRLVFRNCFARQRKDRTKKHVTTEPEILIANDIANIEAVRFQLRSQFEDNIVTQFDNQEIIFDYIFTHLGINTSSVNHPVIFTEPFLNPVYSRNCMSELLFECYGVPKIAYCVDALLSFHTNTQKEDGIVIGIGNCITHVMPILSGHVLATNTRRIQLGGQHLVRFLWRILQLKNPQIMNSITLSRAESILYSKMYIAENYLSELSKWEDSNYYAENLTKVQLPFTAPSAVTPLSADQLKERKKEAAKRLADVNAKRRDEKLEEDTIELNRLVELEEAMEEFTPDEPEYQHALEEAQVTSLEELQTKKLMLQQRIQKIKMKISQASTSSVTKDEALEEPKQKGPRFVLPENIVEKEQMLTDLKQKWKEIQNRKTARKNRRQEMAKRRTLASQERMRIISHLAKHEKKDDTFGINDDDWDVYKVINKEAGGSDSEEDDDRLQEVESILKQHCPEFLGALNPEAKPLSSEEKNQFLLSTEKIRVPELLFQPSMIGLDQGGIADTLDYVLKLHSPEEQMRLVSNIIVTGAPAKIPGLKARLEAELLAMRPFKSEFTVQLADNCELDPWLAARDMINYLLEHGVTRDEFKKGGHQCFRNHKLGNDYWTPVQATAASDSADIQITASDI